MQARSVKLDGSGRTLLAWPPCPPRPPWRELTSSPEAIILPRLRFIEDLAVPGRLGLTWPSSRTHVMLVMYVLPRRVGFPMLLQ